MNVSSYPKPAELMRRFAPVALAAVLSITATACQTTSPTETTGSFAMASPPPGEADWRRSAPDQPDWRVLSVQGAVLDQMGQHEEAQRYYATALRIVPDEPSVLSNLGLSYALSKDLVRAEATLRRAAAQSRVDPRVRQNLALVVGLQGRFAEAEGIAQADLPSDEAAANVAYLRKMLAQQNGWKNSDKPGNPPVRAQGT